MIDEVLGIFLMDEFDTKVVDNQKEGYICCLLFEETGGVQCWGESSYGEVLGLLIVS